MRATAPVPAVSRPAGPVPSDAGLAAGTVQGGLLHLGARLGGGLLFGMFVGGIGARVAMRISGATTADPTFLRTDNGNLLGEITLGGTLALVLFVGLPVAALAAIANVALRPWLAPAGRAAPLVFGTWVLAVGGAMVFDDNVDFQRFGTDLANVGAFAVVFVATGAATHAGVDWGPRTVRRLHRRSPATRLLTLPARTIALALCALALLGTGVSGVTGEGAGSRPISLLLVGLVALALVHARRANATGDAQAPMAPTTVEWVALGAITLVGMTATVTGLAAAT